MEDSSFKGWTSPDLGYPEGRKLGGAQQKGRIGEVRSLPKATDDAIKYARRTWPQGQAADFEREGRSWTDRATGVEYRLVRGNPLLRDDPDQADLFVVEDEVLWFLRRADARQTKSVAVGTLGGLRGTR